MMQRSPESKPALVAKQPVPRGVIVIALLLYLGAAALVAAAALPATALGGVPRWALLMAAAAQAVLATGLFRKRRWAWFGALAFAAVNAYYLYRGVFQGQNQIVGLTLLALMAGYLLLPRVRDVYLQSQT